MKIKKLFGYQVLDSRGRPTIAAAISLDDGTTHTARVPSGASTGKHEAMELRDGNLADANRFYGGKSVAQAVANINSLIAPTLVGRDISLTDIDTQLINLDPSENHMKLGANATLAVSLAAAIAEAHSQSKSLTRFFNGDGELEIPMPMVNILSGGAHAGRTLDIQDVLVLPIGANSFTESLAWIVAIREAAAKIGAAEGKVTHLIADEGGLGIAFASMAQACDFVVKVISSVGLNPGSDVSLALDIASTQFFDGSKYNLKTEGRSLTSADFVQYINRLVSSQPIVSIEDPFAEDDWAAWQEFMSIAPVKLQVLGDDLLTTNLGRLNKAIADNSANAILIKANQNGLVTSTLNVLKQARANNFNTVVSARSGETEDSWLADLATGWRAGQIKVGSTHGAERTAKWNRLLELEATEPSRFSNPFA
ncbi:MAG: enolase [Actinobacteria bacterium BACL2 MAG-121001-bin67]|uniref:Enolase n=1 Tax=Actinobacteria bacterium BACL2 MAG-121001-bin67 TaxID=1655572 RepID=A0A0R2P3E0_9ACTN|nr:MAG: enolase [Actinobacteria bacterium BACL2 MAG-121001-bin67]KRO72571.1 MAG: enolase [Actinobacteria bacterium BACL2 MAG-120920-bin34]